MNEARRVLICDDHRDTAISLAMVLRAYRFEVFSCFEGQYCLRRAKTLEPFAAVIDLGLADVSSYDIAQGMRGLPSGSDMLLIAVTRYSAIGDLHAARSAGFDWHFRQPVSPLAIVSVLENRLPDGEGTRLHP
jgi:CheY-like chemotaxis protein